MQQNRYLIDLPLLGTLIGKILYKANGFYQVHQLACHLPQIPTSKPFKILSKVCFHRSQQM